MKKGEPSRFRDGNKSQHGSTSRDEDNPFQPLQNVIREITTIIGGPFAGGSFRFPKEACQRQVNSVHMVPLFKQRRTNQDMSFNEENARGVKQPLNDPLVITFTIEGFNIKRILVDNGNFADIIYLSAFQQLKLDPGRLQPITRPNMKEYWWG